MKAFGTYAHHNTHEKTLATLHQMTEQKEQESSAIAKMTAQCAVCKQA